MASASPPIREPIIDKRTGRLSPVWERYFIVTLNPSANQLLEQINTEFKDGSIPFADNGFLNEDNDHFTWDGLLKVLKVVGDLQMIGNITLDGDIDVSGTITGKNRAKQYFFSGF